MATDVFPRRNLNPDSEPWGRAIEDATRDNSHRIDNLSLALSGDNRAAAGQMAVAGRNIEDLQRQITELDSRSNATVTGDNLSVTATSGGPWVSATRTLIIPGALGGTRASFISVSGSISGANSNSVTIYVEMESEGVVFHRSSHALTLGPNTPSGYSPIPSGSTILPVSTSGRSLVVRMHVLSFQNSNTITLSDITANILYADVV